MPDGGRRNGNNPYDSGFGTAPTSAIADSGRRAAASYGDTPSGATPDEGWRGGSNPYGERPAAAPPSAPPNGGRRNGNPYDDSSGRAALPESPGRNPYDDAPRGRRGADAPGSAARSALPYRSEPGPAQRSALPYGSEPGSALPYGSQPGSAQPYGSEPGPARGNTQYGGEAPAPRSVTSYGGESRGATPYGSETQAPPPSGNTPYGDRPAPPSGNTPYDDRPAPPSGNTPYGDGPAPRSATPYGGAYGSAQVGAAAPRSAPGYGSAAPRSGIPGSGGAATPYAVEDPYRTGGGGRRRAADNDDLPPQNGSRGAPAPGTDAWRRDPEPTDAPRGRRPVETPSWSRDERPGTNRRSDDETRVGWDNDLGPASRQNGRGGDWRAELDSGPQPAAEPATEPWNSDPNGWQQKPAWQREDPARGYRDNPAEDDWRKDLADRSNLADGESRRYGTSDYVPFRSGGSAAAPRNLSTTGTSLNSPVPREQREAQARPPRTSNGYQGLSGSYERRATSGGFPMSRRSNLLDPDDEEGEPESGGLLAAVGYTVIWYGVPVVLFLAYMLVTGSQSQAVSTLTKAAPQFGVSLVFSILIAVGIRRVSDSWKSISVGLAAAVVGGGLATVLFSAITGNSLS
jgi:hypothetical protein